MTTRDSTEHGTTPHDRFGGATPLTTITDASLSRRLNVAIYFPVAILVVAGALLYLEISRLTTAATWMDHSDKVIGKIYETQKLIIDQETGIRGYLVTGNGVFLQPFNEAHPGVPLSEVAALVGDNPQQQAHVNELRAQYEAWLEVEKREVIAATDLTAARQDGVMLVRKKQMDDIRAVVEVIRSAENILRRDRTAAADEANRNVQVLVASLLVAVGILITFLTRRQVVSVAESFRAIVARETDARVTVERQEWIRAAQMRISASIHGDLSLTDIGSKVLSGLVKATGAEVGAFYVKEATSLRRYASHGVDAPEVFARGEGLVSEAAVAGEVLRVTDVPKGFLRVRTATAEHDPVEVVLAPAAVDEAVHAVVELGFLRRATDDSVELISRLREAIAIAVRSAEYRKNLTDLVTETQAQARTLQAQQEELNATNAELEEQSEGLRNAQKELELQQAELEQTNENLELHARLVGEKNESLKKAEAEVTARAEEVARANRYKSEFLANMSHELRTPLNSSLILSKLLADNTLGNLTDEQVKFASTIHSAGNDLLTLINDILDLSKVEAGRMSIDPSSSPFARVVEPVQQLFEPVAQQKSLALEVRLVDVGVVVTDIHKVQQILKNLLSNALKFTEKGTVTLHAVGDEARVTVTVADSGIGIAPENLGSIFEAFRQADGTTHRKYGGTGLGLSISRDLARLLGGDLTVSSELGRGSTFTLVLPRVSMAVDAGASPTSVAAPPSPRAPSLPGAKPAMEDGALLIADDRERSGSGANLVLIAEDDPSFAQILLDLVRDQGLLGVVSGTADEAFRLAVRHSPRAILLDMNLPDHSGLTVLDRLKRNAATRHIPVHVTSVADYSEAALAMGAVSYALKPVRREELVEALAHLEKRWRSRTRRLLVVEDDPVQRAAVEKLLGSDEVETVAVGTVKEALVHLRASTFDCVVTDLTLPEESGYELLEQMAADDSYSFPPVIVYTGRSLTRDEEQRLRKYSSSIIVKGARSPERLLDEATLFLHQVESSLTPERQRMIRHVRDREAVFEGRRVLVVEDDVRNIFALTAVLEPRGAIIEVARNGHEALALLDRTPTIDLVLMDIMMPEMDGITCIQTIRKRRDRAKLPIIALTAKAMKDDQERCLKAGANDFVSKPLDVEMLLSLLRVWMPK